MPKRAHSDGAATLPSKQSRSSTISSAGSNRVPARVTGDIVPVGTTDWITFARGNKFRVDKTDLLLDIMKHDSSDIILRPRRFGKTWFLTVAHDFFNVAETKAELAKRKRIFKKMNIHKVDPTFVDKHCGRYPVIYLSLKYMRSDELDKFRSDMARAISKAIDKWCHAISDTSKAELNDSRNRLKQMKSNMYNSVDDGVAILSELVDYLREYYNAQCIVLVDSFDAPIMEAYDRTRDRVKRYVRRLLSPLAEDNTRVRKFIMVGTSPVNLDTFGPGMNNCRRYLLHEHSDRSREDAPLYQTSFGFTKEEVEALLDKAAVKWGLTTEQGDHLRR
ncbi:hypothetical protein EV182_000343, partial [Spiromyces aspiralis]